MAKTGTLGKTGLEQYSGYVQEEFHDALRGRDGIRIYREMSRNDAVVGSVLYAITSLIQQTPWRAEPADRSEEAIAQAKFLTEVMNDMSHTWDEFLSECLSMVPYGWSYFEKVYKNRRGDSKSPKNRSRHNDGKLGIRKIAIRSQDSLDRWDFDSDGGINGMWQTAAPNYIPTFIPISKSVLFRIGVYKNNPEGSSLLRNAFRSWYFLKRLQEIEAVGIERDLVGLPVFEVPLEYLDENAEPGKKLMYEEFKKMIQQVRRNEHEGMVIPTELDEDGKPTGFKFRLASTGGSRAIDIHKSIVRYEQRIAMTMLASFIMMGLDKVGSFSLSDNITNIFATSLGAMLDSVEETFNRFVVEDIMKLNGVKQDLWPRWKHGDIEKPDLEKLGKFVANMSAIGAINSDPTLEDFIRELAGFPAKDEEFAAEQERLRQEQQNDLDTDQKGAPSGRSPLGPGQVAPMEQRVGRNEEKQGSKAA